MCVCVCVCVCGEGTLRYGFSGYRGIANIGQCARDVPAMWPRTWRAMWRGTNTPNPTDPTKRNKAIIEPPPHTNFEISHLGYIPNRNNMR